jgi:hypothetical protein
VLRTTLQRLRAISRQFCAQVRARLARLPAGFLSLAGHTIHGNVKAMRRREITMLGLLFAAALALRLFRLSNQSLWMDEISSVETARVPMNEMVARSAQNNALPTYFLLLRPMVGRTNEHIEARARVISTLAGAVTVPIFAYLVFCWYGQWAAAFWAGLLLAVNPLHLWYSQEARGYALMLCVGLGCLLSFELARSRGGFGWWIVYVGAAILTVAVHKTGLIFPLCCAIWDGWKVWHGWKAEGRGREPCFPRADGKPTGERERSFAVRLSPHLVLVAIVALILIEPSQPPAREYGRPNSGLEIAYTAMTFIGGYSFGLSLTDIQNEGGKPAVLRHLPQTAIIGAVLIGIAAVLICRWRIMLKTRATLLLVLPVIIGFTGATFSSFPYNVRYTLPALFGFLGLLAGLPQIVSKLWVRCSVVTIVLAIHLWADYQWFFVWRYRKGDSRAVAQWLVEYQPRVTSWTVLPDYLGYAIRWYLDENRDVLAGEQRPKQGQTTSFPPVPDVLIIGRRHHVKDPDAVVKSYREAAGYVQTIGSFAGFELYVRDKN